MIILSSDLKFNRRMFTFWKTSFRESNTKLLNTVTFLLPANIGVTGPLEGSRNVFYQEAKYKNQVEAQLLIIKLKLLWNI